jgi:hypothetical protein
MPALSTTRPLVLVCLLTNELLNDSLEITKAVESQQASASILQSRT